MASPANLRTRDARWRAPLELLELVRREPGITRAAAAHRLRLSTGSATEITTRLRGLALLVEVPAPITGPGRPTTALVAHPRGPVALVVDLRHEGWRTAVAGLDGLTEVSPEHPHEHPAPAHVLARIGREIARARRKYRRRLRAVSIAVPGTVADGHLVQAATLGWGHVDLGALGSAAGAPVLIGNDATLAGVAEARSGAAGGAAAALHLIVEVGVGGTLVVDGRPQAGATGAGGEFGHLPFGDPARRCPCGAHGCWGLEVDGMALARHLGSPPPADAKSYARRVLARPLRSPEVAEAIRRVAAALGTGTAGLVNALDPDVVTLGGLAIPIRQAGSTAFEAAYRAGLMSFRRPAPPPVHDAVHGDDGPLWGAADVGLDRILTEEGLAGWAADLTG